MRNGDYEFANGHVDGVLIAAPVGEIAHHSADQFRADLSTTIGHGRPTVVRLDLVTYLDATGITALTAAHAEANTNGLCLALAAPHPHIASIITTANLAAIMPVHDRLRDAISILSHIGPTPRAISDPG